MPKNSWDKLKDRLRSECVLEIPEDGLFRRTYAGDIMRSNGAWSWSMWNKQPNIGSQFSVTEILKAKKISAAHIEGDIVIFVEKDI